MKDIQDALGSDPFGQEIFKALKASATRHPRIDLGSCEINRQGLLIISEKIYVPVTFRTRIISNSHDHPASGHPGRSKTFELVYMDYQKQLYRTATQFSPPILPAKWLLASRLTSTSAVRSTLKQMDKRSG